VLLASDIAMPEGEPQLLQVVDIPLATAAPSLHQPENWMLASGRWRSVRTRPNDADTRMLLSHLVPGPHLLGGQTDRVPFEIAQREGVGASLAIIRIVDPHLEATIRPDGVHVRLRFELAGTRYNLVVTDPFVESAVRNGASNLSGMGYAMDRLCAAVSLSEPFMPAGSTSMFCFKLIAGVFSLPSAPPPNVTTGSAKPSTSRLAITEGAPSGASVENDAYEQASTLTARRRTAIETQLPGLLERYPRAYSSWTDDEDEHLRALIERQLPISTLAELHRRHPGSIRSRLKHLGLD
jgi:hypothetical protein